MSDHQKKIAGEAAAALVEAGMVVGLGTGSTAAWFVKALAARGLPDLRCVPTSEKTADLARDLGLTRSNVSNHLACLRDCGIVRGHPQGRQTRYEIADPHLAAALVALVDVTLAVDEHAPCVDSACTVAGCCGTGADA